MKLFHLTQKCYQTMGIYPTHPTQNPPINLRSLFFSIIMLLTASAAMASCLFQASHNAFEHAYTFYVSLTQFACMINFLISFWKMADTISFINDLDDFIQRSKCFFG